MAGKPWETYAGAKLVDAPSGAPAAKSAGEEAREAPAGTPPWEKYKNATLVAAPLADALHAQSLAGETESHLNRVKYTAPDSASLVGWVGRVGRSASFGVSDIISSKIIGYQLRKQDPSITDEETLVAIRQGFNEDVSITAEIVGSLAPGRAVAKGLGMAKRLATAKIMDVGTEVGTRAAVNAAMRATPMSAASRAGILKGATQWLAKDKIFSRIASAAGGGAAMGAVFEAVRESVDQAVGTQAGEHINPDEILTAGVQGAIVGALMGPVANEALRGVGGVANWVKQAFGGNEATTMNATKRIVKKLSNTGETPDQTVIRVRQDIANFKANNGRTPALFEIVSPDKAAEIADVAKYYSGLNPRMRTMTDKQVIKAIDTFEDMAKGTKPLKDTQVNENFMRDQFNSVMSRHGDDMVEVGDEAMAGLSRNRAFLESQAKENVEARMLLKIVKADDDLAALSAKAGKLSQSKTIAQEESAIADLRRELADLIDEAKRGPDGVELSEIGELKNLIKLQSAIDTQFAKAVKAGWAEANSNNAVRTLQHAQKVLNEYRKTGAKITLRTANAMRANASKLASNPNDPNAQMMARAVREAIAPVGTKEVNAYGRVIKLWNVQSTRVEAAALGKQAIREEVSPENLAEVIRASRLINKTPGSPAAIRKGIEEGARIDLRNTARSGPKKAISRANKIDESKLAKENIKLAIPGGGKKIIKSAEQLTKTDLNRRIVNSKMSPSELAEQAAAVKDEVMAALSGSLGGTAFAAIVSRYFMKFKIPRKTATKLVDMLTDPDKIEDALSYVIKRGIDPSKLMTLIANTQISADDKRIKGSRNKDAVLGGRYR